MSDPETGQRRRLEEIDALRYLDAVQRQFKEAPEYYDRFLDAMTDHKNGVTDTLGTVEAVIDLLHPFPGLLLEWNIFLPEGWAVHSSPDPEDSHMSIVNAKTPSGDMTLRKSVPLELYPLLLPNEREEPAPIFTLLNDVKTHYVENPKIYEQLLKVVQPRPDVDDNQMITEISEVLSDTPQFIRRFRDLLGMEP